MARTAPARKRRQRPTDAPRQDRADSIINLRVSRFLRQTIDEAADSVGKTRTEFILDSVRNDAIDAVLNRRFFRLTADQHAEFVKALDAPPKPNEKLKRLMQSKAPWEK